MQKITQLAALKAFYEENNDLIGLFSKVVLVKVPDGKTASIVEIQEAAKSQFSIYFPDDVMRTVIKRLKKEGYIGYEMLKNISKKTITLTDKGKRQQLVILECIKDVARENNALLQKLRETLRSKGIGEYKTDKVGEYLDAFIEDNSYEAASFLSGGRKNIRFNNKVYEGIADFIIECENADPENFKRLKGILFGKVISTALFRNNFDKSASAKNLVVYLDTNIVFSLMGYHSENQNRAARELRDMMARLNAKMMIFSFTKEEIKGKLRGYLLDYGMYSSEIEVNSIYYNLKKQGKTTHDILLVIADIDNHLERLNIQVDHSFDIKEIINNNEDLVSKLLSLKQKHINSVYHDVAAIVAISKLRDGKAMLLERAKFVFLTADIYLSSFDYKEFHHGEDRTFPEVVFRAEFASLLWLKNMDDKDCAPIHNFLANYASKRIVSGIIWDKFIRALKEKKESGELSDDQIDIIMSFSDTSKILLEKGEEGIPQIINEERISAKIALAEEKNKNLKKSENFIELQKETISQQCVTIEQQKKEIEGGRYAISSKDQFIDEINVAVEAQCRKSCEKIINGVLDLLIVITAYWLYHLGKNLSWGDGMVSAIADAIGVSALGLIPFCLLLSLRLRKPFKPTRVIIDGFRNIENRLIEYMIIRKKKELKLLQKVED